MGHKQNRQSFSQIHQEKERTQINISSNEKGEVTTDTTEIHRIIRDLI